MIVTKDRMFGGFCDSAELTVFGNVGGVDKEISDVGKVVLAEFTDTIGTNVIEFVMELV